MKLAQGDAGHWPTRRIEAHVERHGDEQVRAGAQRRRRLARDRIAGHLRDDPHIADVVARAGARRIRPIDIRREAAGRLVQRADELDVVVVVGRGVLLHAPRRIDEAEFDVVGRIRFAVGAVAVSPRFELREHLRERAAADARHRPVGLHLDGVDLVVDGERLRTRRAGHEQIARARRRRSRRRPRQPSRGRASRSRRA